MRSNSIREYKPTITGTLTMASGNTISLINSDFVANSLAVRSSTSSGGVFNFGGVNIGAVDFTLINTSGKFDSMDWYDSTVEIELSANGETIDLGRHWVIVHNETGHLISVRSHDILTILDRFNLTGSGKPTGWAFPMTIQTAIGGIQNWVVRTEADPEHPGSFIYYTMYDDYGLTIDYSNISATMLATVIPDPGSVTLRGFMSYIAQICGQYIKARGNSLIFDWYSKTPTYNAGTTFNHELDTNSIYFNTVEMNGKPTSDGGVGWRLVQSVQHTGTMTGTPQRYVLNAVDNPLITDDNYNDIADAIADALADLDFRPGSAGIVSDAALEAGDAILISTGQESNIPFIITGTTYKPQLVQSVTSDGARDTGDLRPVGNDYMYQIAKEAAEDVISGQSGGGAFSLVQLGADSGTDSAYNTKLYIIDQGYKNQGLDSITGGTPTVVQLTRWNWAIEAPPVQSVAVPSLQSIFNSVVADGFLPADAPPASFWNYVPLYEFDVPVIVKFTASATSPASPSGDTAWRVCYTYRGCWTGTNTISLKASHGVEGVTLCRALWYPVAWSDGANGEYPFEMASIYMPRSTAADFHGQIERYTGDDPQYVGKWYFTA